jgi:hypothetical protein
VREGNENLVSMPEGVKLCGMILLKKYWAPDGEKTWWAWARRAGHDFLLGYFQIGSTRAVLIDFSRGEPVFRVVFRPSVAV